MTYEVPCFLTLALPSFMLSRSHAQSFQESLTKEYVSYII